MDSVKLLSWLKRHCLLVASVHTTTDCSFPEAKDEFYREFSQLLRSLLRSAVVEVVVVVVAVVVVVVIVVILTANFGN